MIVWKYFNNNLREFLKVISVACLFGFTFYFSSCKKLIEVEAPFTSLNAENVYSDDATAAAVLSGIYGQLSAANRNSFTFNNYLTNITFFAGLSADELTLYDVNNSFLLPYYTNSLNSANAPYYWDNIYPIIFTANSAISGLTNNSILSPNVQQQLMGEAKFIRAFSYFYLVNLYGGVPLVLTTDPDNNSRLPRSSVDDIYSQIIHDLEEATSLLSENFLSGSVKTIVRERVRPTKWAALALLAKVYLYRQKFSLADSLSTVIIQNGALFSLNSLEDVFLKNSSEAIWQLQCVTNTLGNTGEGQTFVLPKDGVDVLGSYPVYLSKYVVNSFEVGDLRKLKWIDSISTDQGVIYYPFKYKSGNLTPDKTTTEYLMVLRLAEIYLIRSEARAQLNDLYGAQADLNLIRNRAGLGNTLSNNKDDLLTEILAERQRELFVEWGNRWLDLKRSNTINGIMSNVTLEKGGTWNSNWQYYPISNSLLLTDHNLMQNDGY